VNSLGGTAFIDFAKSKEWGKDLFEDLVAPYFKADFLVESWGVSKHANHSVINYN
jgi:hypothetical protein